MNNNLPVVNWFVLHDKRRFVGLQVRAPGLSRRDGCPRLAPNATELHLIRGPHLALQWPVLYTAAAAATGAAVESVLLQGGCRGGSSGMGSLAKQDSCSVQHGIGQRTWSTKLH